jgi:hypothetical protein
MMLIVQALQAEAFFGLRIRQLAEKEVAKAWCR